MDRVENDCLQLVCLYQSIFAQNTLVSADIDNLPNNITVLCQLYKFALQSQRQFVNNGGIYKRALLCCKSCFP